LFAFVDHAHDKNSYSRSFERKHWHRHQCNVFGRYEIKTYWENYYLANMFTYVARKTRRPRVFPFFILCMLAIFIYNLILNEMCIQYYHYYSIQVW
jgi:hypothetical protein